MRATRLLDLPRDIFGIDAWQAKVLSEFQGQGGTLAWPETRTPITLDELFARPAPRSPAVH